MIAGDIMNGYSHEITIDKHSKGYGFLRGTIDEYSWFALVHKEVVDYGVNPKNLSKGMGRITRLCIYKEEKQFDGNPFLPSMTIKRSIYANYHRGWSVLNSRNRPMIMELVTYLERRYSFRIVK